MRKEVSVLFSDLRDFTPLAESVEPEEVLELLNQYLGAMTEELFHEGGTLDKYTGDGLMAFFGDPGWYPDHAERAFRASIRMQARMRELHAGWQARGWSTPGMGIGVCTGHVTVGSIGSPSRMEYTALGSTVNAAARLSSIAGPGETLTTRKSYSRVERLFHGRPRGRTPLKGFSQAVEVVEITGARVLAREADQAETERLADVVSAVVDDPSYRAMILTDLGDGTSNQGLDPKEAKLARDVASLCGYPLFRGVPSVEILALLSGAATDECAAGTTLIEPGAAWSHLYIVLEGDMVVITRTEDEREQHIASLSAGDAFGDLSVVNELPNIAMIRAISPCRLLVLQSEEAQTFLDRAPVFRERLQALTARRSNGAPGNVVRTI